MYEITLSIWMFLWIILTTLLVGAVGIIYLIARITHWDNKK